MSEHEPRGPVMLAVTDLLRPPPTRVAKIGPMVLPRSITMKSAVAGLVGAIVGLIPAFVILGVGANAVIWGGMLGATAGAVVVNWSPLRGESFSRWIGLNVAAYRSDKVEVNGREVNLYIGVARIHRSAAGRVRLEPGAVSVPAGSVDDRGVPVAVKSPPLPAHAPFPAADDDRDDGERYLVSDPVANPTGLDYAASAPTAPSRLAAFRDAAGIPAAPAAPPQPRTSDPGVVAWPEPPTGGWPAPPHAEPATPTSTPPHNPTLPPPPGRSGPPGSAGGSRLAAFRQAASEPQLEPPTDR